MLKVKREQFLIPFSKYSIYFNCILKKSFMLSNLILEHYHKEEHVKNSCVQFGS